MSDKLHAVSALLGHLPYDFSELVDLSIFLLFFFFFLFLFLIWKTWLDPAFVAHAPLKFNISSRAQNPELFFSYKYKFPLLLLLLKGLIIARESFIPQVDNNNIINQGEMSIDHCFSHSLAQWPLLLLLLRLDRPRRHCTVDAT